jgi:YVTN family beta-propeller protein
MRFVHDRVIGAVLVLGTIILTDCKKPEREVPAGTVPGNVQVTLPSGSPAKPSELHVMSGVFDETDVGQDGTARIGLNPNAVSAVVALCKSNKPLLFSVAIAPSADQTVRLDARSTAEALVFLHPFIAQSGVDYADQVMSLIRAAPEVSSLSSLVETRLRSDTAYLMQSDSAFTATLLAAVKAIHGQIDSISDSVPAKVSRELAVPVRGMEITSIKSVATPLMVGTVPDSSGTLGTLTIEPDVPISGISVRAEEISTGNYRLWVKNSRRRHLSAYCMDLGTSLDSTLIWSCGFITLIPPSFGKPESSSIALAASQHPATMLRVYGPGCHTIEEWKQDPNRVRIVTPASATCVFNFFVPLVSAFTGLPGVFGKGTQTGIELNQEIISDGVTAAAIVDDIESKSVVGIATDVASRMLSVLQDNPDLLVRAAAEVGITITLARAQEILGFLPYLAFMQACIDAANIGWTIGTIARSQVMVDFMVSYSGGTNRPPTAPSVPAGTDSGSVGTSYDFSTFATDPDSDQVQYRFDWGSGDTSAWSPLMNSGSPDTSSYSWGAAGTYLVQAQARDEHGAVSGWSGSHQIVVSSGGNHPPNTPSTPSGPSSGWVDSLYSFTSSATDSDGDRVRYEFDWGDGQQDWTGLVASGVQVQMSHAWTSPDTYNVKVMAQDERGSNSGWSPQHSVVIGSGRDYPDTVVATVPVGSGPGNVAALPNGSYVYVTNGGSNTVSVIRTSNNTVVATVLVGDGPWGVAALPNGSYVYVTNGGSNTVSVIRTSNNTVVATVLVGDGPEGVAALPNGSHVYVANNGSSTVSVIRASDNTVVATVPVGWAPAGVAALPNCAYVYVVNDWDNTVSVIRTSDNTVVATIPVGYYPVGVAALPNGGYIYVANSWDNTVSVIRTSDNTVVATVPLDSYAVGVAALPNGSYVYVAGWAPDDVSVIRTSDNTMVATVLVGARPFGVASLPDGNFVYVVNGGSGTVSVIGY